MYLIKKQQTNWKYVIIVVSLFLVVAVGILVYQYWWALEEEVPFSKLSETKETEDLSAEDLITADWKTYRNEEYGFEFKYPSDWGEVISKEGNRSEEGVLLCGAGTHIAVYGIHDSNFLYDIELVFSKSPIEGSFSILKYNPQKPLLWLCDENGDGRLDEGEGDSFVDLLEDKKYLENLPIGETIQKETGYKIATFINFNGLKIFHYPERFETEGGINQFYKFYGDTIEVEGLMTYENYYAKAPDYNTAEKAFNNFHMLIQTFKFIE